VEGQELRASQQIQGQEIEDASRIAGLRVMIHDPPNSSCA
jgi:hypothetical protein